MSTLTHRSPTLGIEREPWLPSAGEVFEEHAARLLAAVRRDVRTSPVNVEDACTFAWLQFVRFRPGGDRAFPWLRTTAVREAVKLDRRAGRLLDLDRAGGPPMVDPRQDLDRSLDVLAALDAIDEARLRPRERRLIALRAAGYSRHQMAALTGDSYRTVDRQLVRAQAKLRDARSAEAEVGSCL
jgi:DNA-directed RNA polymerase specialized sigma24 family protein